ncbi:MAG: radical SAM family heme chaperone HemW [Bacilli bacterium]|nr:radical SAM family heme chaperone HemW [Bacilli bacterium]
MTNNKVKSLYVHIPFCEHICDYCDFPKLQYFRNLAIQYLVSLKKEISDLHIQNNLDTIYIGGGTPTVLESDLLIELFEILKPYTLNLKEYCIETNPETLTQEKVSIIEKYHINRISIGVESTSNRILKSINRHHTFEDVISCVSLLKKHSINNINVDLILGLPNVTKDMLKDDLKNILNLNVEHISAYSLTVHPNTIFYMKGITENSADYERELYDIIHTTLTDANYIHYEISNFAKEGYFSKHNFTYWNNEQYYAVGLGASGYINNIRYSNTKNLSKYNNFKYERKEEQVTKESYITYAIMLNLRTYKGLDCQKLKEETDYDILFEKKNYLRACINNKDLIKEKNIIKPTYKGMMILDQIILNLLP